MFNVVDTTSGWKVGFVVRKDREFSVLELQRRISAELLGVRLFVASAEDTVLAKLEWAVAGGSERQLGDAAAVLSVSGEALDWNHLWRWADALGVRAALRELTGEER